MTVARYIVGPALDVLRSLPDGSVDCLVTSPPYPWQRSYLPPDHPDKAKELGQEADPGKALGALLEFMDAVWPVLTDSATFWVNLGDVHAGSGGAGGDYDEGGLREGQARYDGTATRLRRTADESRRGTDARNRGNSSCGTARRRGDWPLDQSVCFIPHLFGASLAYGRNLLTGEPCRQWVVRPPVTWCKPSPSVGRLDRRFRTATELIIYGGKHQRHYFDLDAVRTPVAPDLYRRSKPHTFRETPGRSPQVANPLDENGHRRNSNEAGAPPFNWWEIDYPEGHADPDYWIVNHPGYAAAHFATFPAELIRRPILAGCPAKVCTVCGHAPSPILGRGTGQNTRTSRGSADDPRQRGAVVSSVVPEHSSRERLGYSDCGHDSWRRGVVLDPFAGSGTTGAVATGNGRDAVLIDLDERNRELARDRIGLWFVADEGALRLPSAQP